MSGSPTSCCASRPAAIGLTVMVLATRVGEARCKRHHPQDEGERAAGDAEIDAGEPLRRAEAREHRQAAGQRPAITNAAAPAAHADGEEARARSSAAMKGREKTL